MKTVLALVAALLMSSAFAEETRHMIEFNADSVLLAKYALDKSKTRGSAADNDSQATLKGGYAYSLPTLPRLQVAGRMNYVKATVANDVENYGFQLGVIWNHSDKLANSLYASLYLGMQWNNTFGNQGTHDENRLSTFAIGRRVDLTRWGLNHLTYTPEIALLNQNSTTDSNIEYSQSIELRFLQFAVFF